MSDLRGAASADPHADHVDADRRPAPAGSVSRPATEREDLLAALAPMRHDGVYVYASLARTAGLDGLTPVATFREAEGLTVIVDEAQAQRAGLNVVWRCAWITLTVPSELDAVGLTAAVAAALEEAGIACNLVAAIHHDHLFVPLASADAAIETLRKLQRRNAPRARHGPD